MSKILLSYLGTMASLLQYCLQKIKTVSQKTVKSPIQFFHKDLRLTNISNSWTSEHAILCKIEPKVTKVDPKNLKKRPFYVVIFFSATRCDRETILYRYYIQFGYKFFKFRVLRMLTQRCYGGFCLILLYKNSENLYENGCKESKFWK